MAEASSTSTESPQAPAPKTIEFDSHGDLFVVVGPAPSQTLLVDSRALCRSSTYFSKMLRGGFAESRPESGDWTVNFPEDKVRPFIFLMDMVHAAYERTPLNLVVDDLYDPCVLTNKYDFGRVLRPMAPPWSQNLANSMPANSSDLFGEMLFICWELGRVTDVTDMAIKLARGCSVDEKGDLIDPESKPLKDSEPFMLIPFMDGIVQYRANLLRIYRTKCKEIGKKFFDKQLHGQCHRNYYNRDCNGPNHDDTMLGKLIRKTHELGVTFLFIDPPDEHEISVLNSLDNLDASLSEIQAALGASNNCDFQISGTLQMIKTLCDTLSSPISFRHKGIMRNQATKISMQATI
ncbi:hypothetical protein ACJ41O_002761 [Fusarium nematophilum]